MHKVWDSPASLFKGGHRVLGSVRQLDDIHGGDVDPRALLGQAGDGGSQGGRGRDVG